MEPRDDARMSGRAKRRRTTRSGRAIAAAAVLAGGLLLAFAFAGVTIQENALARDIRTLHAQIASEQAKNTDLQAAAVQKKTPDYVIEKAKDFGFVWPWETLIAVQRDAAAHAGDVPADNRPPHVLRWVAVFFGAR